MKTIVFKVNIKNEKEFKFLQKQLLSVIDDLSGDLCESEDEDDYSDEKFNLEVFNELLIQLNNQK